MMDELLKVALGIVLLLAMNLIGRSRLLTAKYTSFSDFFNYDSSVGFNAILRILAPSIFIVAISIILYSFKLGPLTSGIWKVALYYALIQTVIVFFVLGRARLVNKSKFFFYHLLAIALAYWVYNFAIIKGLAYLLPDEANFRTEMWFVIILFLYGLLTHLSEDRDRFVDRQNSYVLTKLESFKLQYGDLLSDKPRMVKDVTYALMIYEDYVRPRFYRYLEKLFKRIKNVKTSGIMQVMSERTIDNRESVELTVNRLLELYGSLDKELDSYKKEDLLIRSHNDTWEYKSRVSEVYQLVKAKHEEHDKI